jgi:hypothetical protein
MRNFRRCYQVGASALSILGGCFLHRYRLPSNLAQLGTIADELSAIQISKEILEVAEAIVDVSDGPGVERTQLEYLVRYLLYVGRKSELDFDQV